LIDRVSQGILKNWFMPFCLSACQLLSQCCVNCLLCTAWFASSS
jgi:hypothetical protein